MAREGVLSLLLALPADGQEFGERGAAMQPWFPGEGGRGCSHDSLGKGVGVQPWFPGEGGAGVQRGSAGTAQAICSWGVGGHCLKFYYFPKG